MHPSRFEEPSLSGRHINPSPVGGASASQGGAGSRRTGLRCGRPRVRPSAGELAGHRQGVTPVNAPHDGDPHARCRFLTETLPRGRANPRWAAGPRPLSDPLARRREAPTSPRQVRRCSAGRLTPPRTAHFALHPPPPRNKHDGKHTPGLLNNRDVFRPFGDGRHPLQRPRVVPEAVVAVNNWGDEGYEIIRCSRSEGHSGVHEDRRFKDEKTKGPAPWDRPLRWAWVASTGRSPPSGSSNGTSRRSARPRY